jgi:hypothetical protein
MRALATWAGRPERRMPTQEPVFSHSRGGAARGQGEARAPLFEAKVQERTRLSRSRLGPGLA